MKTFYSWGQESTFSQVASKPKNQKAIILSTKDYMLTERMCVWYHKYSEATRSYRTLFTMTAKGNSSGFLKKNMVSSFWKYGQRGVHTQSKLWKMEKSNHTNNVTNKETAYYWSVLFIPIKTPHKWKSIANTQNC